MATPVTVSATRIALSCLIPAMATLAGALPQGAGAGATVASAALAENEGRYAEAEQLLRRVVASGDNAAAARARTRLDALLQRQGKASEVVPAATPAEPTGDAVAPTTQGPPADPITRLIQKLDTGTKANAEVKQAISQLDDLGSLIVPHLLGALPQFGPFGVHNALQLLRYERDDRIATTLGAMLDQGKPEVVAAITGQLGRMHAAVGLPLAQKIAGLELDSGALGAALSVLIEQGGHDELAQKLAQRMLDSGDEAMQRALLAAMSDGEREWFGALYDALRACDGADVRASATFQHIEAAGLDEDAALAAIAGLESRDIAWRISALGERHPDWARMGAIGLRVTPTDDKWDSTRRNIIEKFEWWRAPEQAMPELLKLPMERNNIGTNSPEWAAYEAVGKFLSRAAESGWQLPEKWDEAVAERVTRLRGDWRAFVGLLPADAEQRALRIWRAAPVARVSFAASAIVEGRPWHDLASAALLEFGPSQGNTIPFLRGDWAGASETAVARLRTFVEQTAKLPSNTNVSTASEIVRLYADTPSLPDDLVMPLVEVGNNSAWKSVCCRSPRAVLTYARDGKLYAPYFETVRSLLLSHGTTEDLPVALRVVREAYVPNQDQAGMRQWFGTQVPGHLDIVRLDRPEVLLRTPSQDLAHTLAGEAATRIRAQDVEAALKLLPEVGTSTRGQILYGVARVVGEQHVGALRDALRADLRGTPMTAMGSNGPEPAMPRLVKMLASTGDRSALPELRAVLEREDLSDEVILAAARGIVATAGDRREREFAAMLDSERAVIAQAALYSFGVPEAGDPAMVDRAIVAMRRHGAELKSTGGLFREMTRKERVRAAKAILESEGMREFGRHVVTEAIDQLADNRDPAHVPAFALAATHRETNVRLEAAKQLGNSFDRSAVPHLLDLLRDESSKVRQAAQSGLDQIANYLDQLKMWQDRFGDLPAAGKGK